ncbi:hypothetical protein Dda_3718 [Drechslerella dactyloides]|uniref:Uncharacterized protein n=1 Tax=Drechslerella dactyloides TaxID=74499 RepID=A0AAD6NLE6_DREDA|nr:hypothetical protein Dda_3718 [Drechslerella dactyloides]
MAMSLLRIAAILAAVVAVVAPPPPDPPTGQSPTTGGTGTVGGIVQTPNIIPATSDQLRNSEPLIRNLRSVSQEGSSNSPTESRDMDLTNMSNLSVMGTNSQNNTPRSIYRKQARYLSPQDRKSGKSPFRPERSGNVQWKDLLEIEELDPNAKTATPSLPVSGRWNGMPTYTRPQTNMNDSPMAYNYAPSQNRVISTMPVGILLDDEEVDDITSDADGDETAELDDDVDFSALPPTNDLVMRMGPITSPRLQSYLRSRPPVMYYEPSTGGQGGTVNTARLQYAESQNE